MSIEIDKIDFVTTSWDEIHRDSFQLCSLVSKDHFVPDYYLGISRGGLVPSRLMLDFFGKMKFFIITLDSYNSINKQGELSDIQDVLPSEISGKKFLVIDDIADSGSSLQAVTSYLRKHGNPIIKTAVLWYKPISVVVPDYYVHQTSAWVVFPWEHYEFCTSLLPDLRRKGLTDEEIFEYFKEKFKILPSILRMAMKQFNE